MRQGQDNPPAAYSDALRGKHVVPGADGHGLRSRSRAGTPILKRRVRAWGGTHDTRDPNWDTNAGARRPRPHLLGPKPNVLVVHSPDLNSYAKGLKAQKGRDLRRADRPTMTFRPIPSSAATTNRLGQLETEAAVKGCGDWFSQEDPAWFRAMRYTSSIYQYNGIAES